MQKIQLYRYIRDDGGVTVSTQKPPQKTFEPMYRLIADEGNILKKDNIETYCADIEVFDYINWREVEAPKEIN